MIRTLTGLALTLAVSSAAHAEGEQRLVRTAGLSPRVVRIQLYKAAEAVCEASARTNGLDSGCVEATYTDALHQLHANQRMRPAAYDQTAALSPR